MAESMGAGGVGTQAIGADIPMRSEGAAFQVNLRRVSAAEPVNSRGRRSAGRAQVKIVLRGVHEKRRSRGNPRVAVLARVPAPIRQVALLNSIGAEAVLDDVVIAEQPVAAVGCDPDAAGHRI